MGIDKEKLGYFTQAMAALSAAPVASYPESGEYRNALRLQDQTAIFTAQAKAKKEAKKAKKKAKKAGLFKTGLSIAGRVVGGPIGGAIGGAIGDAAAGSPPDLSALASSGMKVGMDRLQLPGLFGQKSAGLKPGPDDFLYPSDQDEIGTYRY